MNKAKMRSIIFTVSGLLVAFAPAITLFKGSSLFFGEAKYPNKDDYQN